MAELNESPDSLTLRLSMDDNDPAKADYELLAEFQQSMADGKYNASLAGNSLFEEMLKWPANRRVDIIVRAWELIKQAWTPAIDYVEPEDGNTTQCVFALNQLTRHFLAHPMEPDATDMERLIVLSLEDIRPPAGWGGGFPTGSLVPFISVFRTQEPAALQRWQPHLRAMRQQLSGEFSANMGPDYHYGSNSAVQQLAELMETQIDSFVERGDAWADKALADLDAMDAATRTQWRALFVQAQKSKDAKPKEKWLREADALIDTVGREQFRTSVIDWLSLYGKDDGWWFADREERNDAFFKGLVWMASRIETPDIVGALGAALRGSFKARGRAGVRSQRVGNACIWALGLRGESEAAAYLVNAKTRMKYGSIVKTLEKTIEAVAARANMTAADLEELAVPDFGLENGVVAATFDSVNVKVEMVGSKAVWTWTADGKPIKSVPASVKRDFADELKELKARVEELEKSFATQKERLDSLLRIEKTWEFPAWKQRYLEHPLMQLLARRLIWRFEFDGGQVAALPVGDGFRNATGEAVSIPTTARVGLYHPLLDTIENVLQWRRYLEDHKIQQPFKQAHREVYLLTDAERNTRIYSNRFASHIVKQHQFNSLCAARGWKNTLRLMVDDSYPPAIKVWPNHNLRAEYWVEGAGNNFGTDTNEAGTYLRLSTDQVRFYPLDAPEHSVHTSGGGYSSAYGQTPVPPLELEQVPPLTFSETMRDVDLFVGVASLGADPNWSDGGPDGHFRAYWTDYAWGELSESAKSRADVLSRLLPRLKFGNKVSLEGRYLRVQGKQRTYKIHLGSSNILMEPNDQYLCIVPARHDSEDLLLPFEGDRVLAVILSKAFFLFNDDKIKDSSILSQIAMRERLAGGG